MNSIFFTGVFGILASGVVATLLMVANATVPTADNAPCNFSPYQIGAEACTGNIGQTASPPAAEGRRVTRVADIRAHTASRD